MVSSANFYPYLNALLERGTEAGLPLLRPETHSISLPEIIPGVHISTSVSLRRIQVNLNLMDDRERTQFRRLQASAQEIEDALGTSLLWDDKSFAKKATIRDTLQANPLDTHDWPAQQAWAIARMRAFTDEFIARF